MAIVRNTAGYSLDLTGGRMLAPLATANVDASAAHEQELITAGLLVVVDGTVSPPEPAEPLAETPRRVFVATAQPADLRQGDVWLQKNANGTFDVWENA